MKRITNKSFMNKIIFAFCLFTISATSFAQTADIFWALSRPENGPVSPFGLTADIHMSATGQTDINFAYDYDGFTEIISNVPYATWDYTITDTTGDCRTVASGQIIVDTPNETETTAIGSLISDATVFFFLSAPGEPVINDPVSVTMTGINGNSNNYTYTYDYNSFEESLSGVAFGDYSIKYERDCHLMATGSVTVSCDAYNNPNPGVIEQYDAIGAAIMINSTVTQNSEVLTANATGATISYQWVDCNNGDAPINGETNQEFTATSNGSYAVIITDSNCSNSEKSSCYDVTTLGLEGQDSPLQLKLFPNPVIDDLNISFGKSFNKVNVQVFSMLGQLVKTVNMTNSIESRINISELSTGTYIVKIEADGLYDSKLILKK